MDLHYDWSLKDAKFTRDKGSVFSCFSCGGGSSFGYKLAGFDVIGAVDIDPKMMEIYRENHNPKYSFVESVADFKNRDDLPEELYNLDILDGSPPCSSFSMSGNREKDWGKKKKFREGQAEQELDRLFFDFIDLAKKLQPKVVVAENVKGILQGNAKKYVTEIYKQMDLAGYHCQHFLLDASNMGVPQRRERVFFIGLRKDLAEPFMEQVDMFLSRPDLELSFNEAKIPFGDFYDYHDEADRPLGQETELYRLWKLRDYSDKSVMDASVRDLGKQRFFGSKYIKIENVPTTLTASNKFCAILMNEPRAINKRECCCIGAFPQDYNFLDQKYNYVIGMSVPPLVIAKLSNEIHNQWLKEINEHNTAK